VAAFTIVSETYRTRSALKSLFEFLGDFKNFKSILPEEKVTDFNFSGDECSFNIKGITKMSIRLTEKKEFEYILFQSEGLAKFNFYLKANFEGNPNEPGNCKIELSGDMNPFIKSMAEKPLTDLVNTMSQRLSRLENL
jgi:hypothetical protein